MFTSQLLLLRLPGTHLHKYTVEAWVTAPKLPTSDSWNPSVRQQKRQVSKLKSFRQRIHGDLIVTTGVLKRKRLGDI